MKKQTLAILLGLAGTVFTGLNASSATFVASTTYGGHTYSLYDAFGISWDDAQTFATAQGGYLAVLTTSGETTSVYGGLVGSGFFLAQSSQDVEAWLGARPADGSSNTTDPTNWAWVTGETWTAFDAGNFAGGEPNGDSSGLAINRFGSFGFNDEGGHVGGFIVETPDFGMTSSLLGISLLGLAYARRKLA